MIHLALSIAAFLFLCWVACWAIPLALVVIGLLLPAIIGAAVFGSLTHSVIGGLVGFVVGLATTIWLIKHPDPPPPQDRKQREIERLSAHARASLARRH